MGEPQQQNACCSTEYLKIERKVVQIELHYLSSKSSGDATAKENDRKFIDDVLDKLRPILQERIEKTVHSKRPRALSSRKASKPHVMRDESLRMAYSFRSRPTNQHCLFPCKGKYKVYPFFEEKVVVQACRVTKSHSNTSLKDEPAAEQESSSSYFGASNLKPATPLVALRNIVKKSGPRLSKSKKRKKNEDEDEGTNMAIDSKNEERNCVKLVDKKSKHDHHKTTESAQSPKVDPSTSDNQESLDSVAFNKYEFPEPTEVIRQWKSKDTNSGDGEQKSSIKSHEIIDLSFNNEQSGGLSDSRSEVAKVSWRPARISGQDLLSACSDTDEFTFPERNVSHTLEMNSPGALTNDTSPKTKDVFKKSNTTTDAFSSSKDVSTDQQAADHSVREIKHPFLSKFCDEVEPNLDTSFSPYNKSKSVDVEVGMSDFDHVVDIRRRIPRISNSNRQVRKEYDCSSDSESDLPSALHSEPSKSTREKLNVFNFSDDSDASDNKESPPAPSPPKPNPYDVYDFDLEPDPELSTIFRNENKESKKRRRLKQNLNKFQSMEDDLDEPIEAKHLYTSNRTSRYSEVLPSASFVMHNSMVDEGDKDDRLCKAFVSLDKPTRGTSSSDDNPITNLPSYSSGSDIGKSDSTLGPVPRNRKLKLKKQSRDTSSRDTIISRRTRRRSKWEQLIFEWDDDDDDLTIPAPSKTSSRHDGEDVSTGAAEAVDDDEALPVFNPEGFSKDWSDKGVSPERRPKTPPTIVGAPEYRATGASIQTDTRSKPCRGPKNDHNHIASSTPMDEEIDSLGTLAKLGSQHIIHIVRKYQRDLLHIFKGQKFSRRHQDYKSGGKKRNNLKYQIPMGCFEDEQHDAIMETLLKIFCRKNQNYLDYVLKVMLPEAIIMVYMEVYKTDAQTAEKNLTLETTPISLADFI